MNPVWRSMSIWVRVPTNTGPGATIQFPDKPELQGCFVTAILSVTAETSAFTTERLPVITGTDALNVIQSFNQGSDQRHMDIPYLSLNQQQNAGIWVEVEPFRIDWQKCEAQWLAAATVADFALLYIVQYMREEDMIDAGLLQPTNPAG